MSSTRNHGFTLVEMLVGLMVSSIIVAGSITLLINQQQAYQNTSSDRAGQESARLALGTIGDALRRAGYGVHPSATFDFGTTPANVIFDSVNTSFATYIGRDCTTAVSCRDNADGPAGSDQIAFYARDPYFVRALFSAPIPTQLTVVGAITSTNPLLRGQVLAVACGGVCGKRWAYVTVDRTAPSSTTGATDIFLQAGSGLDFPKQNSALADSSFGTNLWNGATSPTTGLPLDFGAFRLASKVFKIDRFRFYIDRITDPDSGQLRPYLMLDQGLSDNTGSVRTPVAPDIDDLQFAYVFPNAPLTINKLIGATAGTPIANNSNGIDLTMSPPVFLDAQANSARNTQNPANIRAVKVSVVVRSPESDITLPGKALINTYLPAAGNRAEIPSDPSNPGNFPDPYHWRALFESTFEVTNMDSHALSCGDYTDGTTLGLNVGGG